LARETKTFKEVSDYLEPCFEGQTENGRKCLLIPYIAIAALQSTLEL